MTPEEQPFESYQQTVTTPDQLDDAVYIAAYREYYGVPPLADHPDPAVRRVFQAFRRDLYAFVQLMKTFPQQHDQIAALASSQGDREREYSPAIARRIHQLFSAS